jgi:hypothetical protein
MVHLLVLSCSDQLLFVLKQYFNYLLNQPCYEVNCTETTPSVRISWPTAPNLGQPSLSSPGHLDSARVGSGIIRVVLSATLRNLRTFIRCL